MNSHLEFHGLARKGLTNKRKGKSNINMSYSKILLIHMSKVKRQNIWNFSTSENFCVSDSQYSIDQTIK